MSQFLALVKVMKRLRAPNGCPWDRKQTHTSLLKYLKEESQELASAVRKKDWYNLQEELGDVLLQVIFHSEMARQRGAFDIEDVVSHLKRKLVMRHPHVFGNKKYQGWTAKDVVNKWDDLKALEKAVTKKEHAKMKRRMRKIRLV